MNSTITDIEQQTTRENGTEKTNSVKLTLNIMDVNTINYLGQFEDDEIDFKALEALKIGVIAIQSATPTIDTNVVRERFGELVTNMDECLGGFNVDVKQELDKIFNSDRGTLTRSMGDFLGDNGTLGRILNKYFGKESGYLLSILSTQIGPGSDFAKNLDPQNKDSVVCKIENIIKNYLENNSAEILNQFSLDVEDSAISRLKNSILSEVSDLKQYNGKFFTELKEAMGFQTGQELEAEKGTEKGREFEMELYDCVAEISRKLGDETECVRGAPGIVPRRKTGDYKITLGDTSGAPGINLVVEVKNEQNYKLKTAIDEMKLAKKNRDAVAGIFVFETTTAPPEVGNFLKIGNDFYVTVDQSNINREANTIFFEAAYKIQRALVVTSSRKQGTKKIDLDRIRAELESSLEIISRIDEFSTKAKTIKNNSEFIIDRAKVLKGEMDDKLEAIIKMLR